ncbi:MAG: cell division protein FtsZ, partial [Methanomassiliicoccales archaeon]|nr:cell division protein FtsZ [Methanomassiliicoccales archaeon]
MKSILDRVLETDEGRSTATDDKPVSIRQPTADDEELRRIVETLRIKIAIIGCGGGGSNTIRRLYQAGIIGATLVAANSDAKHLLSIAAPNKVLLGRNLTRG